MGWLKNSIDEVREATKSDAIDCPRGWGDVAFGLKIDGFPPFCQISRQCPLAGVSNCSSCHYPFNPEKTQRLRETLVELENLCEQGILTETEYQQQRRQLLLFTADPIPGSPALITAWILGPLGGVFLGTGWWLAENIHPGFWGVAVGGGVLLALAGSFAGIGWTMRRNHKLLLEERI